MTIYAKATVGLDLPTGGGELLVPPHSMVASNLTAASGVLELSRKVAERTEDITQVTMWVGGVAAGATPTLCRIGIYEENPDGLTATLVGTHASDTAMFSATGTAYTKTLTTPFVKRAGRRYAAGALVVSAATMPQFQGVAFGTSLVSTPIAQINGRLSGLSDLPASFNIADLANTTICRQVYLRP